MLRISVVLALLALFLMPALALAQPQAEDWELTLTGVGTNNKDFSNASVGVALGLGYFLSPNAEIAVRQSLSYSDADHDANGDATGGGTSLDGSTRVAFDWHIDFDQLQPFLGINGGYAYGDLTNDTWIAGLEGGLKFYVHRNAFVYAIAEYQFDLDGRFGDGAFVYGLGIGVNW